MGRFQLKDVAGYRLHNRGAATGLLKKLHHAPERSTEASLRGTDYAHYYE